MKEINSFILYYDFYLLTTNLTAAEKGLLLDKLFLYHIPAAAMPPGKKTTFETLRESPAVNTVFEYIRRRLDFDREKYIKRCERNAENVKKRYEARQKKKDDKKYDYAGYDLEQFEKMINEDD